MRAAQGALADELSARGAQVRIPKLPTGPSGQKVGLDDYLLAHTKEEFDDFIVRFEWRPAKKGYNSGFFIRGRQIQMAQGMGFPCF